MSLWSTTPVCVGGCLYRRAFPSFLWVSGQVLTLIRGARNQYLSGSSPFLHRAFEMEADRLGLRLAAGAGYQQGTFLRYNQRTHLPRSGMSPLPGRDQRLTDLLVTRIER